MGRPFLGAVIFCMMTAGYAQNLITNGSFEVIANPTNSIVSMPVGSTVLPGWTVSGTGSFYVVTTPLTAWTFQALEGRQFVDLNNKDAVLSQSFVTSPGVEYEVSFVAGLFQGLTGMAIITEVLASNGSLMASNRANAPAARGWAAPTRFRFTAIDGVTKLQFRATNATVNVDLAMDAVSVEPVVQHVLIAGSPLRLCWESKPNRSYQLQYRSTLTANSWTDLEAAIAGSGSLLCSTQSVTEPQRFFRVVMLP
ncbi:MAG: DUF642 domain-containing protein [Verrucomicrobiota bacterium]